MAKTLLDYRNIIERSLGQPLDPRIKIDEVVNEAGRYLTNMHPWTWLNRPAVGVDFTASQNYITLPTDFEQLLDIIPSSTIRDRVQLVSLDDIQLLRNSTASGTQTYWVALEYPTQSSVSVLAANARLSIYPTPGSNETDALSVIYRAGWVELAANTSAPNIPLDMETIFADMCRAFAAGYSTGGQEGPTGLVSSQIDALEQTAMLQRMKTKYGSDQWNLGQSSGGIVQTSKLSAYRPHRTITSTG